MKILRRPALLARVGISQATVYRMMSRGEFPRPVRVGQRATGWRTDEVEEWLASRPHTVPESPGRAKVGHLRTPPQIQGMSQDPSG